MSSTEADLNALRAEVAQLRTDFAKISDTLLNLARHGKAEAFEKLKDSTEDLRDHVKKKTESLTREIEERPVAAALTSLTVGLILGALFAGRRD